MGWGEGGGGGGVLGIPESFCPYGRDFAQEIFSDSAQRFGTKLVLFGPFSHCDSLSVDYWLAGLWLDKALARPVHSLILDTTGPCSPCPLSDTGHHRSVLALSTL